MVSVITVVTSVLRTNAITAVARLPFSLTWELLTRIAGITPILIIILWLNAWFIHWHDAALFPAEISWLRANMLYPMVISVVIVSGIYPLFAL